MLLKYLESCPFTIYVASQICRTPWWNQKQLMAFESQDSVPLNYDTKQHWNLRKRHRIQDKIETAGSIRPSA